MKMTSTDALAILSDDQRQILNQFRNTVQDILQPQNDDYYLLRWLRARNFDIRKSEKMIRESYKFRKKLNADELTSGQYVIPEVYKRYRGTAPLGFDKENCLVRYLMGGLIDFKGYIYSLRQTDALKLIMFILENDAKALEEHNKKVGSHETRCVYVVDMRDFNLRQFYDKHVMNTTIQVLNMYQDNYPETLKVAFLINVPTYFNWVWNILKPFLDAVTLSKIKICRPENESWKKELFEIVDPKIIPAFLGGLRCDPDGNPTCQTLVKWPGKIPTSYYLKDKCALSSKDPNVKSVVVRERSHFEHRIPIEKPGSTIKWEIQTKDYNIRFGVFHEKLKCGNIPNSPPDELIAVENVECHVIPESGQLLCEKAGQYILHFDNSYSWFTSKHLLLKVSVIEPEESNIDVEDN